MKDNITVARKTCLRNFQRLRVLQESHDGLATCVSCGAVLPINKMHGGHFIEASARATELEPMNVHPQCPRCNVFRHGSLLQYRRYLVDVYGEEQVRQLEDIGWNDHPKRTIKYYREQSKAILEAIKEEERKREQGEREELSDNTGLDGEKPTVKGK